MQHNSKTGIDLIASQQKEAIVNHNGALYLIHFHVYLSGAEWSGVQMRPHPLRNSISNSPSSIIWQLFTEPPQVRPLLLMRSFLDQWFFFHGFYMIGNKSRCRYERRYEGGSVGSASYGAWVISVGMGWLTHLTPAMILRSRWNTKKMCFLISGSAVERNTT